MQDQISAAYGGIECYQVGSEKNNSALKPSFGAVKTAILMEHTGLSRTVRKIAERQK